MHRRFALLAAGALIGCVWLVRAPAQTPDAALEKAVHNPGRDPAFVARDPARHPAGELAFFGLTPHSSVVEIWPGGGYWTEILAPYLAGAGHYTAALPPAADPEQQAQKFRAKFAKLAGFASAQITSPTPADMQVAPPGSADFVLTFRNVHNWMDGGYADAMFAAFYKALKPGGILGVEEHRALDSVPQDPKADNGYVRQDYTIALAQKAGFVLAGSSELDANPRDTKNWPRGVWTLPPSFALGARDHAKYAAIGEADNFILKFRKPAP